MLNVFIFEYIYISHAEFSKIQFIARYSYIFFLHPKKLTITDLSTKNKKYVIFHIGSTTKYPSSGKFNFIDGHVYTVGGDSEFVITNDDVSSYTAYLNTADTTTNYTVYFDNKSNPFDDVYAYPYVRANSTVENYGKAADFPGIKMTYDETSKLYSATFTLKYKSGYDTPKIIFNNKDTTRKDLSSYGQETNAYTLTNGNVYEPGKAANNSGTTLASYSTSDVLEVYVGGKFKKKVSGTTTSLNNNVDKNTDAVSTDFKFTRDNSTTHFTFDTGMKVSEFSSNEKFFIIVNDNKGSHFYNVSSNDDRELTMSDEGVPVALLPYFYRTVEGTTKTVNISKKLYFNDTFATGTVRLHYYTDTNLFKFTVEDTPDLHHTLTVNEDDKAHFDFESKSVVAGSTHKVQILSIPSKQLVDAVTVTYKETEEGEDQTITATAEGNGYYSFTMPAYNATISVTFRDPKIFTVTTEVDNATLGSVAVSTSTVKEGSSVAVQANPAFVAQTENKRIDFTSWTVTGTGDYVSPYTSTDSYIEYTPTSDVKFTATFTEVTSNVQVSGDYYVVYSYTESEPENWYEHSDSITIAKIKNDSVGNYYIEFDLSSNSNAYFAILNSSTFSGKSVVINSSDFTNETTDANKKYVSLNSSSYNFNKGNDKGEMYRITLSRTDDYSGGPVRVYITDGASSSKKFAAVPRVSSLAATTTTTTGGVTVYAKNGTIRPAYQKYADSRIGSTYIDAVYAAADTTYQTDISSEKTIADEFFDGQSGDNHYCKKGTGFNAGEVIKIKTHVASAYKNAYYVKAFCINGEAFPLYGENEEPAADDPLRKTSADYYLYYTIPSDVNYIEITPIYFYIENGGDYSNLGFINFRVENFTGDVKNQWGNTISCQVWYTNGDETTDATSNLKNALGGYPGQPLISSGTYYYTQVPKSIPGNNAPGTVTVQGMTLNNYYWDSVHQYLSTVDSSFKGTANTRSGNAINSQSYDYNDFAALAKMGANDIIFTMKYETKTANKDTNSTNVTDYKNGFHGFVDYFDRGIDLFGHILHKSGTIAFSNIETTNTNDSKSFNTNVYWEYNVAQTYTEGEIEGTTAFSDDQKLWIVSRGYQPIKNNLSGYYGNYATIWDIYTRSGSTLTKVGSLPASCLIPGATAYKTVDNEYGNLPESGDDYEYNKALFLSFCSTPEARTAAANAYFDTFVTLYNKYRGVPAMITYEKAIAEGGVQNDMGLRSDGRWYYSAAKVATPSYPVNPNPKVTAKLKIEYRNLKEGSSTEYATNYQNDALTDGTTSGNGTNTGAKVWFTDPSTGAVLRTESDIAKWCADAEFDSSKFFEFKADSISIVGNGDDTKVYVFKGWQVELSDVEPLNKDDPTSTTGTSRRNAINTFIARYDEIKAEDVVVVSHEMWKNNAADKVAKSGGSGKTLVSVEIQTSTGGHVDTYEAQEGAITINPAYLTSVLNYKYIVTLTYQPDETSHYVNTVHEKSDSTTEDVNTMTITFNDVTDLIAAKNSAGIVHYLTDFAKNILNLHFNYYDRPDDGVHEYEDVTTPRTVNISVNYKNGQTTENIIMETMTGNAEVADGGSAVSVSSIRNIMDDYKFWTTQEKAKAGIEALDNLHNSGNTYGETTDALTQYHTDNHGNPVFQSGDNYYYGSVAEKNKITEFNTITNRWVSYKLQSDEMLSDNDQTDPSQVKDIYLWAFNYPREYTVRYHYPQILTKPVTDENGEEVKDNEGNTLTEPDLAVLVDAATATIDASTKLPSNVYFVSPTDTKNPIASVKSYYQQRVGAAYDNYQTIYIYKERQQ